MMYVKHPKDEQNAFLDRKKGCKRGKRDKDTSSEPPTANTAKSQKLILSNSLKATMVTHFNCSEAEANDLWLEVLLNRSVK